jgi:hypothetical protein
MNRRRRETHKNNNIKFQPSSKGGGAPSGDSTNIPVTAHAEADDGTNVEHLLTEIIPGASKVVSQEVNQGRDADTKHDDYSSKSEAYDATNSGASSNDKNVDQRSDDSSTDHEEGEEAEEEASGSESEGSSSDKRMKHSSHHADGDELSEDVENMGIEVHDTYPEESGTTDFSGQ